MDWTHELDEVAGTLLRAARWGCLVAALLVALLVGGVVGYGCAQRDQAATVTVR